MKHCTCRLCGKKSSFIFHGKIIGDKISYFQCNYCGYLQTEEPYWLGQAYEKSINQYDTGILQRNLYLQKITSLLIRAKFDKRSKFLDAAGGYGIFVRLMRDAGYDFYWQDLYSENLLAMGFEASQNNGKYELVTCFEAFEHFVNPLYDIEKLLSVSSNILFSTELAPEPVPTLENWWYYGTEHGQHIGFFNKKSLRFIAKHFSLNLFSNGQNIHLITDKKISEFEFKALIKAIRFFYPFMNKTSLTIQDHNSLK